MKSIKDFIKELQEIEREHPDAVIMVPGHSDGSGYYALNASLNVSTLVHYPGWSFRGAGDYFLEEEAYSTEWFANKPRVFGVIIN
jgi:hypothetical protein